MIPKLYTKKQVAKRFKISEITLSRWVSTGIINSTKIGHRRMFTEEHINEAIKNGEA
jgi:excisionase family DNA binding protein